MTAENVWLSLLLACWKNMGAQYRHLQSGLNVIVLVNPKRTPFIAHACGYQHP